MKHIRPYLNESIDRGSIILITGKPEGEKRKLYATHVLGHHELRPGVMMLFLSDTFYRIKEEDGRLKASSVSYRDEKSLKSTLNLKSPGKISIVRNSKKTPFHWKTLKHSNLHSALKEVESEILGSDYLLESLSTEVNEYDVVYSKIADHTISSIFEDSKKAMLIQFKEQESMEDAIHNADDVDDGFDKIEYEISLQVILRDSDLIQNMQELNITQPVEISMVFDISTTINRIIVRDDYDMPEYSEINFNVVDIEIQNTMLVDGEEVILTKEQKEKIDPKIKSLDEDDLLSLFKKKLIKFKSSD